MPVQPNLFPDPTATPPPGQPEAPPRPKPPSPAQLWLQRTSLFILVLFCIFLGVIVTLLPWLTAIWDHNVLLQSRPWLWSILRLGFVRGIISGLGLLDIWIGISEAIHYRESGPNPTRP